MEKLASTKPRIHWSVRDFYESRNVDQDYIKKSNMLEKTNITSNTKPWKNIGNKRPASMTYFDMILKKDPLAVMGQFERYYIEKGRATFAVTDLQWEHSSFPFGV
jgi:hypothetical protein